MFNLAQDFPAWITVAKVCVLLAAFWWFFIDFFHTINKLKEPGSEYDLVVNKSFKRRMITKAFVFVFLFLVLFIFFGSGKPASITLAEDDGHRKMVEARPEPPSKEQIATDAKTKVDSYLKEVDATPEAARKQSKDYVNEILKRNAKEK